MEEALDLSSDRLLNELINYQSIPLCRTHCQMSEKHNLHLHIQNKITEEYDNFSDSNGKIVKRDRVNLQTHYEEMATQAAKDYVTRKNVL